MNLLQKRNSREPCTESGWIAFDYLLETQILPEDILSLQNAGALTYMRLLKKPFFKVESDYFHIKGTEREKVLRIAVHMGHMEQLEQLERMVFQ